MGERSCQQQYGQRSARKARRGHGGDAPVSVGGGGAWYFGGGSQIGLEGWDLSRVLGVSVLPSGLLPAA